MLTRALSFATNRAAIGAGCRVGSVAVPQFRLIPSAAVAIISTSDATHHVVAAVQRSISTSPPLQSSSDNNDEESGEEKAVEKISDEKHAMIQRWMKWNTNKVWRYEPNHDLIAQIGKEGTTSPLDQFRDLVPVEKRESETVGRSWRAAELRRKSYDDLHKLWYVLYKEKNLLLTESNLARRHGYEMVQPERRKKVRKSMGAIKHVLGERKRKKIADWKAYLEELERFDGLMAQMKLESAGDEIEEAMDIEADKLSTSEKA
ncbi:hypothetical protein ACHAXR_006441 [Thalassiosira sp. AJA248-18]